MFGPNLGWGRRCCSKHSYVGLWWLKASANGDPGSSCCGRAHCFPWGRLRSRKLASNSKYACLSQLFSVFLSPLLPESRHQYFSYLTQGLEFCNGSELWWAIPAIGETPWLKNTLTQIALGCHCSQASYTIGIVYRLVKSSLLWLPKYWLC